MDTKRSGYKKATVLKSDLRFKTGEFQFELASCFKWK